MKNAFAVIVALTMCLCIGCYAMAETAVFDVLGSYAVESAAFGNTEEVFGIDSNGDYAYAAGRYDGMRIFDIRDRSNPKDVTPDGEVYLGACAIDVESSILVSGDELYVAFSAASPDGSVGKGVRKYSLSTPEAPVYICTYDVEQCMGIAVRNDRVFVADKQIGIKVFKGDVADPLTTITVKDAGPIEAILIQGDRLYAASRKLLNVYGFDDAGELYHIASKSYGQDCNPKKIAVDERGIYMASPAGFMAIDLSEAGDDLSVLEDAYFTITDLGLSQKSYDDLFLKDGYVYLFGNMNYAVVDVTDLKQMKVCVNNTSSSCRWVAPLEDCMVASDRHNAGVKILAYGEIPNEKASARKPSSLEKIAAQAAERQAAEQEAARQRALAEKLEDNRRIYNPSFKDILTSPYRASILAIAQRGLVDFGASLQFRPDDAATYAEWFQMLTLVSGYDPMEYDGSIPGISGSEWYAKYAYTVARQGFMTLDGIDAQGAVTMADIASSAYRMLCKLAGMTAEDQAALPFLRAEGILTDEQAARAGECVTRGEAADILYKIVQYMEGMKMDMTSFKQVPIILTVTDAVMPGDAFNITGEGFDANTKVYIAPVRDAQKTYTVAQDAQQVKILSLDEENGQYLTAFFPQDMAPGAYHVWIENAYGSSINYPMNATRTLWLEWDRVSASSDILVSGRNFLATEFGAENDDRTAVRLVAADGTAYPGVILTKATCGIRFTVGEDVPYGDYVVQTTNDGILWSSLEDDIEGGVLKVEAPSEDPYNLRVAWANEFNYTNRVNVKDYGAVGDGSVYDTDAINAAIDTVAQAGGGVVYFPAGTYKTEQLKLPGYVILEGAGMDQTKLLYRANVEEKTEAELSGVIMIESDLSRRGGQGHQGLVNLWIDEDKSVGAKYRLAHYYWLGNDWNPDTLSGKTAQYLFVKGVRVGSPSIDWNDPQYTGANGIAYTEDKLFTGDCIAAAKSHYLVSDCYFNGDMTSLTSTYMQKYASIRNNTINTIAGNIYLQLSNSVYENNHITRAPWDQVIYAGRSRQGIYTRHNAYVDGNTIINTGAYTADGEVIAIEDYKAGMIMYGNVEYATADSVRVQLKQTEEGFVYRGNGMSGAVSLMNVGESGIWDMNMVAYPRISIVITQGKGMGQIREIATADKYTRTFTLKKPWDIIPDETSKFNVYLATDNNSITNNYMENCGWAILLYAATNDTVITGNTGKDMMGISAHIIKKEQIDPAANKSDCRARQMYRIRIAGNSFTGYAWKQQRCAISIFASIETKGGALNGRYVYDWTVKGNSVVGEDRTWQDIQQGVAEINSIAPNFYSSQDYVGFDGIQIRNLIWSAVDEETMKTWDEDGGGIHAIIIEQNHVGHTMFGISLGGNSYDSLDDEQALTRLIQLQQYNYPRGLVVKDNSFESVAEPISVFDNPADENYDVGTVYVNGDGEVADKQESYKLTGQ